jgi:hypothetical protein
MFTFIAPITRILRGLRFLISKPDKTVPEHAEDGHDRAARREEAWYGLDSRERPSEAGDEDNPPRG